jgi:hypothetical protein
MKFQSLIAGIAEEKNPEFLTSLKEYTIKLLLMLLRQAAG